jgi:hypothetical protein
MRSSPRASRRLAGASPMANTPSSLSAMRAPSKGKPVTSYARSGARTGRQGPPSRTPATGVGLSFFLSFTARAWLVELEEADRASREDQHTHNQIPLVTSVMPCVQAMRIEVDFVGGKNSSGIFVHKLLSQSMGYSTAAFAQSVLQVGAGAGASTAARAANHFLEDVALLARVRPETAMGADGRCACPRSVPDSYVWATPCVLRRARRSRACGTPRRRRRCRQEHASPPACTTAARAPCGPLDPPARTHTHPPVCMHACASTCPYARATHWLWARGH